MKKTPLITQFILLSCFFLVSCNGSNETGNVFQVELNGGQGSTDLEAGSGGRQFIIIPFSAPSSTSIAGSTTFSMQIAANNGSKLSPLKF